MITEIKIENFLSFDKNQTITIKDKIYGMTPIK